jgi:hypothetical protein
MRKSKRLQTRFPEGTKYVLESVGGMVRRFVEFPDGRKITLPTRKAQTCCAEAEDVSIVPIVAYAEAKKHRRRSRAVEMA